MKKVIVTSVVLLCVTLPILARQRAASGDEAGVAKSRSEYQKVANANDAAGIARRYTTDGVEMPPNAPAAKGRAAIEAYHKALAAQATFSDLKITGTDTKVLGDTAYDIGTYTQTITPKDGKPISDRGKYVVLLKKGADGEWLLSHVIYNSDVPLPPQK